MKIDMSAVKQRRKVDFDLPTIGLVMIIALSFLLHIVTTVLSGYAYLFLLFAFTAIFVLSGKVLIRKSDTFILTWLISVIVIMFSFLHSQRSNGALLDVAVFASGLMLMIFCIEDTDIYSKGVFVVKIFGIVFAAGVLLARFLPAVYRIVIVVIPSSYRASLISRNALGFTVNTGFSAGYIIAGLIAILADFDIHRRSWVRKAIVSLIMFLALLLTAKRGPTLFFLIAVVFCYQLPVTGSIKIKRLFSLFLIAVLGVIFVWTFKDLLSTIPFIGRTLNSISKALAGEDVSSGRSGLYAWALELFKKNPLFGIGWGRFRTTVPGNVTLVKEFETHNIYLQLLAETGIIGFASFVTTFLVFWNKTRIAFRDCIRRNSAEETEWRNLLSFSLMYQSFFLLYGLTGNPLFDSHFQLMYIFACLIIVAYTLAKGKKRELPLSPVEIKEP